MAPAGRCFSPLSVFQTPPIKEEELPAGEAAETSDPRKVLTLTLAAPPRLPAAPRNSCTCDWQADEGESQTTPTTSQQQTAISQAAPTFFTPEPSLRRANGVQAQLSYDSPVQGAPPTAAAGPVKNSNCRVGAVFPSTFCTFLTNRPYVLQVQPCLQRLSPPLCPRTSSRCSARAATLLSPPCRSTSSRT